MANSESNKLSVRELYLQDHIIPICLAERGDGEAILRSLLGTAFFVGSRGVFLTAKHLLKGIEDLPPGQICGLVVKSDDVQAKSLFAPLLGWESAPPPFDIAAGIVRCRSKSWFSFPDDNPIGHWLDVATLGYPETALDHTPEKFDIHLRALKGYIQRPVDADAIELISPHPECFELSFSVTSGMSGAPLFLARGGRNANSHRCVRRILQRRN